MTKIARRTVLKLGGAAVSPLLLPSQARPQEAQTDGLCMPSIRSLLPKLVGDIDLQYFKCVRDGAPGSEAQNDQALLDAFYEAQQQAAKHIFSGGIVKIPSGAIRTSRPVILPSTGHRIGLAGVGSGSSCIFTPDSDIDLIHFDGARGALGLQDNFITGLKVGYVGAERDYNSEKGQRPALIRLRNVMNMRLADVSFEGGYNGLVVDRHARLNLLDLQFWSRSVKHEAHAAMVFTALPDQTGGSTRVFMANIDVDTRGSRFPAVTYGMLFESADGVQGVNIHLINAQKNLAVIPVGDKNRNVAGGIQISGLYSDTCAEDGVYIGGTATNFGRILFNNSRLRNAGRDGMRIEPADGAGVDGITFRDGEIDNNGRVGIHCVNDRLNGLDVQADFRDNNTDNHPDGGDIILRGSNYSLEDSEFRRGGNRGTAVRVEPEAYTGSVENNDLSESNARIKITETGQHSGRAIMNNRE